MKWNKMYEMGMEKWWNEIYGRGKWEKPEENLSIFCFVHQKTHVERSRWETRPPALKSERLTACAVQPPCSLQYNLTSSCHFVYNKIIEPAIGGERVKWVTLYMLISLSVMLKNLHKTEISTLKMLLVLEEDIKSILYCETWLLKLPVHCTV